MRLCSLIETVAWLMVPVGVIEVTPDAGFAVVAETPVVAIWFTAVATWFTAVATWFTAVAAWFVAVVAEFEAEALLAALAP
jgi:cell division protein FtsW (lipid II flippase)